jgi:hypothetical protein
MMRLKRTRATIEGVMASAEDYLGMSFGAFTVERTIGAGAEAEVFQVLHRGTGRRYVMRLDANDDEIWRGAPVNPPRNQSVEIQNVRGSWLASTSYHEMGRDRRKPRRQPALWPFRKAESNEPDWIVAVPVIYAVKDMHYLIPVSSPFKLRNSVSIDEVFRLAPPDDLLYFEMWEDIALSMLGDANFANRGEMSEAEWQDRWAVLCGGPILCRAVRKYMDGGSLSGEAKDAVIRRISQGTETERELAHNLILRLCGAVSRGRISLDAARATARSAPFRENIGTHDLRQIIACWNVMVNHRFRPENSLALLSAILSSMKEQPPTMAANSEEFEYARAEGSREDFDTFIERHHLSEHELFLQEHAGVRQPFAVLEGAS